MGQIDPNIPTPPAFLESIKQFLVIYHLKQLQVFLNISETVKWHFRMMPVLRKFFIYSAIYNMHSFSITQWERFTSKFY